MDRGVGKKLSVVGCQLSAPPKKSEAKKPISYSLYEMPSYFVFRTFKIQGFPLHCWLFSAIRSDGFLVQHFHHRNHIGYIQFLENIVAVYFHGTLRDK